MKSDISSLSLIENDREQGATYIFSLVVQQLRRWRRVVICLALAFAFGFEGAIFLHLVKSSFEGIAGSCLLAFLCVYCMNTVLKRVPISKPKVAQGVDMLSLLNREVVPLEATIARAVLQGRVVLVTGAAGSIGSELCRQLLNYGPQRLIALDNNETGLFDLMQSLRHHEQAECLTPAIRDITDVRSMERFFAAVQPHVVFHAAAYKHVPLLEQHPEQAIRTNAVATYHLCRIAQECNVQRFIFVSTDKAADPSSILGASKRVGEKIIRSMAGTKPCETRFCAVRFGNVIGSRGSVVPVFTQQIQQGGPVTVTHPQVTRYFMTIPEACGLVILTASLADSGELYLLDMGEPVRIVDVAMKMIAAHGLRLGRDISIVYTGLRPGEKLHETLIATTETLQTTAHAKILRITSNDGITSASSMGQWIEILEQSLHYENVEQLRKRLFEFVHQQEYMIAK